MTEWTSISVTEEQKETLEKEKPDGMAMGAFLVSAIESNSEPELHVDHELADQIKEELENHQPEVDLDELEDRIVVRIAREKEADIATVEQNILNRLDDLQSQLPNDVAGELR